MSADPRSSATLRVVALEATPLVREGLRLVIQQAGGLVWLGATGSPHAVRGGLPRLRPDVAILDSALDPRAGLIRDLADADPTLTVVALLNDPQRTADYMRTARVAGAHGLVRRGTAPANLVAAIVRARSTRWFVDPSLIPANGLPARPRPSGGPNDLLSVRQRQVLDMIAGGMSSPDIAAKLVVSQETVRTHTKQLLRRLGATGRAHAVARAYQLGLLAPAGQHALAPEEFDVP